MGFYLIGSKIVIEEILYILGLKQESTKRDGSLDCGLGPMSQQVWHVKDCSILKGVADLKAQVSYTSSTIWEIVSNGTKALYKVNNA